MRVAGEAIAIAAIGAALIGLTAASITDAARTSGIQLPEAPTAIASRIGAGPTHGGAGREAVTPDSALTPLIHTTYAEAFRMVLAALAALAVLTALVCIVTLKPPATKRTD